ncbi:MAG: hypothetical protein WC502_01485 [Methanolinea sp.]|jgi:hypothetical protein
MKIFIVPSVPLARYRNMGIIVEERELFLIEGFLRIFAGRRGPG